MVLINAERGGGALVVEGKGGDGSEEGDGEEGEGKDECKG